MSEEKTLLVGCGILSKEINYLIEKNNWRVETVFLDSSLHVDFNKLSSALEGALEKCRGRKVLVFYGECHPLIDKMLEKAGTFRTEGQNCIDMLLGNEFFTGELSKGAFFLLEDWALHWDRLVKNFYRGNIEVLRKIFQSDRKYILALRTQCSQDFTRQAEHAAHETGLPLMWKDVTLEHLEKVLRESLEKREMK